MIAALAKGFALGLLLSISVGPVIRSDTAWTLLRQSQQWINDEIVKLRADWGGLAPVQGIPEKATQPEKLTKEQGS